MSRAADFANLDPDLPVALFPVRLEARFWPFDSGSDATELWVRIFPDGAHVDAHAPDLTRREKRLGQRYWQQIWSVIDDRAEVEAARLLLAERVGPHRALWVADATTPTNRNDAPTGSPMFEDISVRLGGRTAPARLLPDQWLVRTHYAFEEEERHLQWWTRPVPRDLPAAPTLADVDLGRNPDVDRFLAAQGLRWLVDFDTAVKVGMAIRIPLADFEVDVADRGLTALTVVGVRADNDNAGTELADLLEAHWYSRGLDLVPQGTPTNNTEDARSGISIDDPDVIRLFELEESAPALVIRPTLLADTDYLLRTTEAHAASLAFGRIVKNVLDRTEHGDERVGERARAMNTALWPSVFGRFLADPAGTESGPVLSGEEIDWLRAWFFSWVRGCSPLPMLRIGAQPYGLLPVTPIEDPGPSATDLQDRFQHHLRAIEDDWQQALREVAQLNPDATDAGPGADVGEDAATIAEALGAVPHPIALRLRAAYDHLEEDNEAFDSLLFWTGHALWWLPDPNGGGVWDPEDNDYLVVFDEGEAAIRAATTVSQQIREANSLSDALRESWLGHTPDEPSLAASLSTLEDDLIPLLEAHSDRAEAVRPYSYGENVPDALGRDDVPRLYATDFDESATPVEVLVSADDDVEATARWLDELATTAENDITPDSRPSYPASDPQPLLRQLLQQSIEGVGLDLAPELADAVRALADLAAAEDELVHPELERLMRETLGLATHRLDAWTTSLATERLASKRKSWNAGIQLGGYGWLQDVHPTPVTPASGFIHGPSMLHAATAAVLRSGWAAYAGAGGEAPLAVDLSSGRVRAAKWIVESVGSGTDLTTVLGSRFERRLHDHGLDRYIDDVRRAVSAATPAVLNGSAGLSTVVDGLLLARAFSSVDRTEVEESVRGEVAALDGFADIRDQLGALAGDLDAVADLIMAQSVSGLLEGNVAEASATMALTGSADAAVPPIRVAATNRGGVVVDHRVVALLEPVAVGLGMLGAAEPTLDAWVGTLLGSPDRVMCPIVGGGRLDLSDLGLSPLDMIRLCRPGPSQGGGLLELVLVAAAGGEVELDPDLPPGSDLLTVDEFGLLGAAVANLIGRGRPLTLADLTPVGAIAAEPSWDDDDLGERVQSTEGAVGVALADLESPDQATRTGGLIAVAALALPGIAAALADPADDEAVRRVITALRARLESGPPDPIDEPATGGSTEDRLERLRWLTGNQVPVLASFQPESADRMAIETSGRLARSVTEHGHRWLRQAAKVRPDLGALVEGALLAESASLAGPVLELAAGQSPVRSAAPWVGVDRPTGEDPHTSLLSVTGAGPVDQGPVCGLFIDGWSEKVPSSTTQTGIAVHHDTPSARPPHAILLATVASDQGFDVDRVAGMVRETLRQAALRAVGPDTLRNIGQWAPAAFLAAGTTIEEAAS